LDWHLIFDILAKLKLELKENFPYKVIDVEGAEADDIIGTLTPIYAPHEKVLILSSDGDFLQLQQYGSNVKQYNPSQKKYVKSVDPILELKEKIIRGDKGDGIPNIFSPSDCFVRDLRQKPITKGMLDKILNEDLTHPNWTADAVAGFSRNKILIDLTQIPAEIKTRIINTYEEVIPAKRNKLLNYFIEHKLKNLMEVIEEF
jgi:5'-3' exonuclease